MKNAILWTPLMIVLMIWTLSHFKTFGAYMILGSHDSQLSFPPGQLIFTSYNEGNRSLGIQPFIEDVTNGPFNFESRSGVRRTIVGGPIDLTMSWNNIRLITLVFSIPLWAITLLTLFLPLFVRIRKHLTKPI